MSEKQMYIVYNPMSGPSIPDGQIEDYFQNLLDNEVLYIETGQELFILIARGALAENKLHSLTICYDDIHYECGSDGCMPGEYWQAVEDYTIKFLEKLFP